MEVTLFSDYFVPPRCKYIPGSTCSDSCKRSVICCSDESFHPDFSNLVMYILHLSSEVSARLIWQTLFKKKLALNAVEQETDSKVSDIIPSSDANDCLVMFFVWQSWELCLPPQTVDWKNIIFTTHDAWRILNQSLEDEGHIKFLYHSVLCISMDNTNVSGRDELVITQYIVWG